MQPPSRDNDVNARESDDDKEGKAYDRLIEGLYADPPEELEKEQE